MNLQTFVIPALATMSLVIASGCTAPASKKISIDKTSQSKALQIPGTHYTTIVFNKGKSSLDNLSKENLKRLSQRAHQNKKKIEEIRILAWSDDEYPDKKSEKAGTKEIILASERAQKIRDYLENNLKEIEDIDSYNMAKRPHLISRIFHNDEYEIKEAFESSGTTGLKLPNGPISFTKASKAIVIIDYEGDVDNLK